MISKLLYKALPSRSATSAARKYRHLLLLAIFAVLLRPAAAQSTGSGSITGVLSDSSGAVIPQAAITITNKATNVSLKTTTNKNGYFEVDSLIPGIYSIAAKRAGFEGLVRAGITLQADATISVPLSLNVGNVSDTVVVTADALLLNTESGSNGEVLTTKQIESLPESGDNPAWLEQIAPGVQEGSGQTSSISGTLGFNGVSKFGVAGVLNANEFSLDGAPNEGNQRGNAINPTGDEIGEMKIDVSGFDATIGHTIGVSVTQSTKSGTNQVHGSLRETYQPERWDALNHFQGLNYKYQLAINNCTNGASTNQQCRAVENNYGNPGTHENNGAFSIGGPVYIPKLFDGRNKLFFFASFLDDVFAGILSSTISIPTVQERSGDFSDLPVQTSNIPAAFTAACGSAAPYYGQYQIYNPFSLTIDANGIPRRAPFCGNIVPFNLQYMSALQSTYNKLLPTPTQNSPTGNNFAYTSIRPQTYRAYTGRFDYAVSQNDHIFVRYTHADYTNTSTGFTVGDVDAQSGPRWIDLASIGWNHIFSARTNLDVTVGGSNYKTQCCYYPGYEKYSPASLGLPSYLNAYAGNTATFPIITASGYQQIGQLNNTATTYRDLAFRSNFTHVQGNHTIRAGGEFRFQNSSEPTQGNSSGTFAFDDTYTEENNGSDSTFSQSNTGLSYAAFLLGIPTTSSVSQQAAFSLSTPYFAFYAGDTWRVTPKLTIIPGVRYEYEFGPKEKHNQQIVGWDFSAPLSEFAGPANAAYQTLLASATPAQLAILPPNLAIQGGPVYAGVNGAPTRQWVNDYRILPRLAVAYQVTPNTVIRGGYGLFFDTLNALEEPGTVDQDGFSTSTSVASSTTYGSNFTPGSSPLQNPFPASNGSQFVAPVGSAAGPYYYLGSSPAIYDHNSVPARAERLEVSVQHQFGSSTLVEAAWLGALTTSIPMGTLTTNQTNGQTTSETSTERNYTYTSGSLYQGGNEPDSATNVLLSQKVVNPFNINNFSALATTNPAAYNILAHNSYFTQSTIALSALVKNNPQMSHLYIYQSTGESKFNEFQLNVTRRLHDGLTLTGAIQLNDQWDRDYFANGYDQSPSWEQSNNSRPYRYTASGVYDLPFGKGRSFANSGWKSAAFGGFQYAMTYEAEAGALLTFNNLFYIGTPSGDIKLRHPVYHNNQATGGYNYIQWLNVGNVVATPTTAAGITSCSYTGTGFVTNSSCQPSYNSRVFPTRVNGVRAQGLNSFNANIQRNFPLRQWLTLETRMDVYNLYNHQIVANPNLTVTSSQFGQVTTDSGNANARWVSIQGRLRF